MTTWRSTAERTLLTAVGICLVTAMAHADGLNCDLTEYSAASGLSASVSGGALTVEWEGDRQAQVRLRFALEQGTPTIRELSVRPGGGEWRVLAAGVTPEFRVVSGVRRVTQQQTQPLERLGVELTAAVLDEIKWEAFWDAPLYIEGSEKLPPTHASAIPAAKPFANHPGMPRRPEEVTRATATYRATACEVRTIGARLEITFPGVEAGIFAGRLQYDVFRGSNLIRQTLIATTDHPSAAFKYDSGLTGLPLGPASRVVWRDLANRLQDYQLGGPVSLGPATVWSSNRLIVAELAGGSIAAFPPPHSFYWARESEQNLGYSWYRKDSESTFSFGMRQAENEEDPQYHHNFALYSARPGTWQRMPVFFYVSADPAAATLESALAFTRGDRFKPLPGYKVMGAHYHVGLVDRLRKSGSPDTRLNDIEAAKAVGIDIYGVIDGPRHAGFNARGDTRLQALADYYEAARRHSDRNFLIMPNTEHLGVDLGGHSDLIVSKPVYWLPERAEGQPLVEQHPRFGTVYNVGSPADMMAMTERENALISMPHPRSKGSTGYPDAIKGAAHFLHPNYHGVGYRWGMGIDASETRLCEYRCFALWDEMNNWVSDLPTPLKQMRAISEARSDLGERGKPPYDDTYGMSPVNYIRLDRLPAFDDMSPIVDALRRGDYFVTTGEVLILEYAVTGTGDNRTITAEVEWTFPLDFVEVVWGDGRTSDRKIISAAHLPAFGRHRFEIPFNAAGRTWVRFAAWDVATNGAFVQPVRLGAGAAHDPGGR
jgi:hypothetical protein